MAFIKNKNLEIGQRVITTRNIESFSGVFEKGTEVVLISIDSHRGYGIQELNLACVMIVEKRLTN